MRNIVVNLIVLFLCALAMAVFFQYDNVVGGALVAAPPNAAASTDTSPSIVPGLVGFGTRTPAGSGRHDPSVSTTIFRVTNLNASGDGSLQDCIYATGPRTCVFEVSGTIDLTGDRSYDGSPYINLKNPYITISGQTAPSPGITIKGKTLRIEAHDVLIQHLRLRVGDSANSSIIPSVRDTILIAGNHDDPDRTPHNIVIDHCSISWGIDEIVSVKDTSHHLTLSNNIIGEGLGRSLHPKGEHSKGLMAAGNSQTIYRNLFIHLKDRSPLDFSPNSVLVNNLSYNTKYTNLWSVYRSNHYAGQQYARTTSVLGNVRIPGANTSDRGLNIYAKVSADLPESAEFYLHDNLCLDRQDELVACSFENTTGLTTQFPSNLDPEMDVWTADTLEEKLIPNVGARPIDRDAVDLKLVSDVKNRTGLVPNCVSPQNIAYPSGVLSSAGDNSVTLDLANCYAGRFDGQEIHVTMVNGDSEKRKVAAHTCSSSTSNKLTLTRGWSQKVRAGAEYKIINDCSIDAGGWPQLANNYRVLTLPLEPHEVLSSGYTRLEEYLHAMAHSIEVAQP